MVSANEPRINMPKGSLNRARNSGVIRWEIVISFQPELEQFTLNVKVAASLI